MHKKTIAVILYGITVAMIIGVFAQNKKQLLSIISGNGKGEENPHLTFLDNHKYKPFLGAVIASIVFMFALLFANINKKNVTLSHEGFSQVVTANKKNMSKPIEPTASIKDTNNTKKENRSEQRSKN